jgi:EmrB/QacA subfamily drug resistance transporter
VNAYVLVTAALNLIGGAAGDRFGRRRVFLMGVVVFALGSAWCGLAGSLTELLVARVLQGAGGAMMIPTSLAVIGATFDESERGKAIGTWAGATAIAGALAPVLGGWLTDTIAWRAIFFINLPFAAIVLLIAARHMPESADPRPAGLDWPGATLVTLGLAGLAFALIEAGPRGWRDPAVLGAAIVGAALLAAFVRVEATRTAPMVPLALFRERTFSGVNVLTLLLYAGLGGAFFFLPFALIRLHGYAAAAAGAAFLPFPLIMTALSRWSGGLIDRFGARMPLIVGPAIAAAGFALFARAGLDGSYWSDVFPPMVVLGLGMAVSVAPLTTAVINAVPAAHVGVASGINNAVADIATLLAVGLFGAAGVAVFAAALDANLAGISLPAAALAALPAIKQTLAGAGPPASLAPEARSALDAAIAAAFLFSFRVQMLAAAALALLGSLCAALTIGRARITRQDLA